MKVVFLLLVFVKSISGLHLVFLNHIFSTRARTFLCLCLLASLLNRPYICFSFQISFSDFLKSFFKTLSLNFRILAWFTPWSKFAFEFLRYHPRLFFSLLIVLSHQSSSSLFSTNVKSVYITFCVECFMHWEEFPSLPI